ncbi:hypothetical protein HanXRQr2_Chr01g0022341 [Helianthus annuus]|uniref:Uncharacterized protein n=1 Tax=Helianthus annuus TaxID=4232 RepID=A0A9K3P3I4_HELAN|nr:hypothetical protein HanXRQr2_Chr01g0022341 [Helianthus annuus]KAJ0956957.1 hypothetical protein HanPSC8_Chr01g0021611 [Helianthus annuus]
MSRSSRGRFAPVERIEFSHDSVAKLNRPASLYGVTLRHPASSSSINNGS